MLYLRVFRYVVPRHTGCFAISRARFLFKLPQTLLFLLLLLGELALPLFKFVIGSGQNGPFRRLFQRALCGALRG